MHHEFDRLAHEKHLRFSVELASDLPEHIATDRALLGQVLTNLISNAFKFTEHGAVAVSISAPVNGWDTAHDVLSRAGAVIAFAISDTGIGMAPEIHQCIFEDFVQGDGSTARHYSGAGLGLSLSARLVGLLQGEITLTSTPQKGSTFVVYVPTETNDFPPHGVTTESTDRRL